MRAFLISLGIIIAFCFAIQAAAAEEYDVVRVCKAIAVAEGVKPNTKNNYHGIMTFWYEGGERMRALKRYKTKEDSFSDCERIWDKYYKRLPNFALADRWTGGDQTKEWMKNFYFTYDSL